MRPASELGFPFAPAVVSEEYVKWPSLTELFPVSFPGVKTSRDDVVVDIDRDRLVRRMEQYFDPTVSDAEMARIAPGAMQSTARFDATAVRSLLRERGYLPNNVVRYAYRPFDVRWLYWEPESKLLDEKRAEYVSHVFAENVWIVAQQKPRREWSRPQVIRPTGCLDLMDRSASCFPRLLRAAPDDGLFGSANAPRRAAGDGRRFNVSPQAVHFLDAVAGDENAAVLFDHAVAILHAPRYADSNSGALRQDWPRIPLPSDRDTLLVSAELGARLAALFDTEHDLPGITSGTLRHELRDLGVISRAGGGTLDPGAGDLAVTARWGIAGKGGVTMPSTGRLVEREYTAEECTALTRGAESLGLSLQQALDLLGHTTCDVYLNEVAYWRNIPAGVWRYTLGGYQVIKKWLSYREHALLGRALAPDEVRELTGIARRIAAILLLGPALDASYTAVTRGTYAWPRSS